MPELPEVETVVRTLRPHLVGRRLGPVLALDRRVRRSPAGRFRRLAGTEIVAVERVGKYVRILLAPSPFQGEGRGEGPAPATPNSIRHDDRDQRGAQNLVLVVHLGMAGRLIVAPPDSPVAKHTYLRMAIATPVTLSAAMALGHGTGPGIPRGPRVAQNDTVRESEIRNPKSEIGIPSCEFRTPGCLELRFINPRWAMGGIWLARSADDDPTAALGPDPLTISAEAFEELLARRRQVKALLLDQRALAGMGNIYCDESLFAAGIHPRAMAGRLTPPRRRRLFRAMQRILQSAIRAGGSSIRDYRDADGERGFFQLAHQVYGHTGELCPRCRRPIRHATVAGRSTHFCPHCQRR